MADDTTPAPEPQAPAVSFGTKEEFTSFLQSKIGEALAPKLKAISALEEKAASVDTLQSRLSELEAANMDKSATDAQKWETERGRLEAQKAALADKITAGEAATAAVTAQWHAKEAGAYITALAAPLANPTALVDIPALFPRDAVQVATTEAGISVSIVDPDTGQPLDGKEVMSAWLADRPHLMASPARGASLPGASPSKTSSDPFEGMTDAEIIRQSLINSQG